MPSSVPVADRRPPEEKSLWNDSSRNFVARSYHGGPPAQGILQECERLCGELQTRWLNEKQPPWNPRCEVVLHASRSSYLRCVGRGGGQTMGSSLIRFGEGGVVGRRLDLLSDASGQLPALPHELCHVVLADYFQGRQPPRWADEGIAMLADSPNKQSLHCRDCERALRSGTALPLGQLLRLQRFSHPDQVPAFYGQSLSLVGYLVEHRGEELLLPFVEAAMEHGYDHALRKFYDIEGVAHLDNLWRGGH